MQSCGHGPDVRGVGEITSDHYGQVFVNVARMLVATIELENV